LDCEQIVKLTLGMDLTLFGQLDEGNFTEIRTDCKPRANMPS
jgi:hypothetical protein